MKMETFNPYQANSIPTQFALFPSQETKNESHSGVLGFETLLGGRCKACFKYKFSHCVNGLSVNIFAMISTPWGLTWIFYGAICHSVARWLTETTKRHATLCYFRLFLSNSWKNQSVLWWCSHRFDCLRDVVWRATKSRRQSVINSSEFAQDW